MSGVPYPYSEGDRLEDRNTYFYTAYHGHDFFAAWRAARAAATGGSVAIAPPAAMSIDSAASNETIKADDFLEGIFAGLTSGCEEAVAASKKKLDRLLQRFEISKRIFERYNSELRTQSPKQYRNLNLYLRFGESLEAGYRQIADLPYLNGLLKCVDTLCSVRNDLDSAGRGRLAWLIKAEFGHVAVLAEKSGVKL